MILDLRLKKKVKGVSNSKLKASNLAFFGGGILSKIFYSDYKIGDKWKIKSCQKIES